MATDPTTNVLWALLKLSGQIGRELVTIDPTTGIATSIGDTGESLAALAFLNDGTLYGVTGDQRSNPGAGTPETLFTLSKVDATPTLVVALGNGDDGETIAFNPDDGLLYHASGLGIQNESVFGEIFETIDPVMLVVTNIPLSGDDYSEATGLTYDQGEGSFLVAGDFFGPSRFFTLTTGGVLSELGTMDHISKGLAFFLCSTAGTGCIIIVKNTVPDDATDFDFTTTGGLSLSTFSLDDDADGTLSETKTFYSVTPGTYTVTETVV